jgi:hypothetical protein
LLSDVLPLTVQLVRVVLPLLRMPPPLPVVAPLVIVRPEMVAVTLEILKTRLALLPLMVSWLAPGPLIVSVLLITSSPLIRVMVPVTEKLIVSPELASITAWRREPAPESFKLVTVIVAAHAGIVRKRRTIPTNSHRAVLDRINRLVCFIISAARPPRKSPPSFHKHPNIALFPYYVNSTQKSSLDRAV